MPLHTSSRNSLRLVGMLAPTFIENPEHANAVASQHSEGVEEQLQSVSTRLGAQVAFMDNYP